MPGNPIDRKLFTFLRALARHNDRAWFQANKARYEAEVRDPLLAFVADFAPRLARISKNMLADPRPVGGSLFRIHRDTRFSKDKRPYKTHAGLRFLHVDGRDVHGPIYYLHLEPGQVFMAAGMWRPEAQTLAQVREAIVAQPTLWKKVAKGLDEPTGALKRPPRGFDPDHPFVEDLKRRSFTSSARFSEAETCAADFPTRYARACRQRAPLVGFLAGAVGLPW